MGNNAALNLQTLENNKKSANSCVINFRYTILCFNPFVKGTHGRIVF